MAEVDTSSYNIKPTNALQSPFEAMKQVNDFQTSQNQAQSGKLELAQKRVSAVGQALIPLVLKDSQGNLNPAEIPAAVDNLVRSNPGVFPLGFQQQVLADFRPQNASQWIRGHAANNPVSAGLLQHVQARPNQTNLGGQIVQTDVNPNTNPNAANTTFTPSLSPEAATAPITVTGPNGQPSTFTRGQFPAVAGAPTPVPSVAPGLPTAQAGQQPAGTGGPIATYPDRQRRNERLGNRTLPGDPNAGGAQASPQAPQSAPALPGVAGPSANFAPGLETLNKDKVSSSQIVQGTQPLLQALPLIEKLSVKDAGPGSKEYSDLKSAFISAGILSPDAGNVALRQEVQKYLQQYVAKSRLSERSDLGTLTSQASSPNLDVSLKALTTLARKSVAIDRLNAAAPLSFNGQPDTYLDHKARFTQTQDPRAYELDLLPAKEKADIIAKVRANPNSQESVRFLSSLRNAHNAGFLKQ